VIFMQTLEKRLENVEKELRELKILVSGKNGRKTVSFRGIAKTNLTNEELDKEIHNAKTSLFKHGDK